MKMEEMTYQRIAIIDSKQIPYDACSDNYPEPLYKEYVYVYIGKGYIYSINGVRQTDQDIMHFWRKVNK